MSVKGNVKTKSKNIKLDPASEGKTETNTVLQAQKRPTSKKVDIQELIKDTTTDDSNGGESDKKTSYKTYSLDLPIGKLILRHKWIQSKELDKYGKEQYEQIDVIETFLQTISSNGYKNKTQMKSSDLLDIFSFLKEATEFIKEFNAQESMKQAETLGGMG